MPTRSSLDCSARRPSTDIAALGTD